MTSIAPTPPVFGGALRAKPEPGAACPASPAARFAPPYGSPILFSLREPVFTSSCALAHPYASEPCASAAIVWCVGSFAQASMRCAQACWPGSIAISAAKLHYGSSPCASALPPYYTSGVVVTPVGANVVSRATRATRRRYSSCGCGEVTTGQEARVGERAHH